MTTQGRRHRRWHGRPGGGGPRARTGATRSWSSSAAAARAAGPDWWRRRGSGSTPARPCSRCRSCWGRPSAPSAPTWPTCPDPAGRAHVPSQLRRRLRTPRVDHGRAAMSEEIGRLAGSRDAAALRSHVRVADRAVPGRDGSLHRRQLRLAARPPAPRRPGARAGRASAASAGSGQDGRARSSTTSGSGGSSASSRCTPVSRPYEALALYAVITYMDSVEGVFVPVGGMHMMARRARRGGHQGGRRHPVRHGRRVRSRAPRDGRSTGVVRRGRRARRGRRRRVQRRPPGGIPRVARRPRGAAGGPRAAGTRRRAVLWIAGVRACRRRMPPTTTSTSVPTGTARSGHSSTTGCGCPTRRSSSRCTASTTARSRPPGCSSLYVLEPVPNLARAGSTGRANVAGSSSDCGAGRFARLSDRRRRRGGVRPDRLGTHGHGAGHARSPSPTRSSRPGRSGRTTSSEGARAWCSRVRRTLPGVGVPMVLVSGKLAAERVDEYAARARARTAPGAVRRADADHDCCRGDPRRELRAVPAAQQASRHDVLLVDQAPAKVKRTTCTRCTASAATPTTSSTTWRRSSRRGPRRAAALRTFGDRFFADLDRRTLRATRC